LSSSATVWLMNSLPLSEWKPGILRHPEKFDSDRDSFDGFPKNDARETRH